MAFTYGFYNSVNGDRKYNAMDFSAIFDGIINDGVFMSVGTCFMVKAASLMSVTVGIGRAWFNHTWSYNDSELILEVDEAESFLNRIDTVILEVNNSEFSRMNAIKILKGTPSSNPSRPALTKTQYVHQYPLAYISVGKGVTEIGQADITNMVGTTEVPFVTGILETIDATPLLAQWEAEYRRWLTLTQDDADQWTAERREELLQYIEFFHQDVEAFTSASKQGFIDWFAHLQSQLDDDQLTHLQNQIDILCKSNFERYYGMVDKTTRINKKAADGSTESIVETSDEVTATTVFLKEGDSKTIRTILVPKVGNWDYIKNVVITNDTDGKTFVETYSRTAKTQEVTQ